MRTRIAQELELLKQRYGEVSHVEAPGEDWFKLGQYLVPPGWNIGTEAVAEIPVAFFVAAGYPGAAPYGFLTPANLNFKGTAPQNTCKPKKVPPFDGSWLQFSWSVENWVATGDIHKGSNLLAWSRSFWQRLKEGV